jgi:hypothetical protein
MIRPRLNRRSANRAAAPFAPRRATAWALGVWSVYIAAWAWVSGSDPTMVAVWWLAGVVVVRAVAGRPSARPGPGEARDYERPRRHGLRLACHPSRRARVRG